MSQEPTAELLIEEKSIEEEMGAIKRRVGEMESLLAAVNPRNSAGLAAKALRRKVGVTSARVAGENLAAGTPVRVGIAGNINDPNLLAVRNTVSNSIITKFENERLAQSFRVMASCLLFNITFRGRGGTGQDTTYVVDLTESVNNLPATVIATSGSLVVPRQTVIRDFLFHFSVPISIQPNITYWFVLRRISGIANVDILTNTGNVFADGAMRRSHDNGATWSAEAGDMWFIPTFHEIAGRIYQASANAATNADGYVGFTETSANLNEMVTIRHTGLTVGLSGLAAGQIYYISDTRGGLSTSPGTVLRLAGVTFENPTELMLLV